MWEDKLDDNIIKSKEPNMVEEWLYLTFIFIDPYQEISNHTEYFTDLGKLNLPMMVQF
jgi:hypothetical protein